jgi:hypothetical protein
VHGSIPWKQTGCCDRLSRLIWHAEAIVFGLLDRFRRPRDITSTISFHEDYCHSAGEDEGGKVYEIKKGTTEIIFDFNDFDAFMRFYFYNNRHVEEDVKKAVAEGTWAFCAQVVEDQAYMCTESVGADHRLSLRAASLTPLQQEWRLREFSNGAIGLGIYRRGQGVFHLLWATMYKATLPASGS